MVERIPPALAAYLTRVNAEQLNFKAFIVRIYRGHYYIEKDIIRISLDGTITCNNPEHEPTEVELLDIGKEMPDYIKSWPKSMLATHADDLRRLIREKGRADNSLLFEFYQRHRDTKETEGIIMVQERIDEGAGKKKYVPWSYYTDGVWRCMEPMDRKLPFWKPRAYRGINQPMVHEGPKAAMYCDWLVNHPEGRDALAKHPWGEVLAQYEHWGAIGGALAPQRSDYDELRAMRFDDLVYVCDNDYAGKSVAQEFSRHYGKKMKAVMFADNFGARGWDLADEMPRELFDEDDKWIGPTLQSLMRPATRATELVRAGDKGRLSARLLQDFGEEWMHSVTPDIYINRGFTDRILTTDQFNDVVRPFSDVEDTARLMRGNAAVKSWQIKYDPSKPSGIQDAIGEGQFINTYSGPDFRGEEGDIGPWIEFMEHLIPDDEDRIKLMRWCATLIARPDIRINYGVLLISETQGVGKGTLGEKILLPLIGKLNASVPSEADVVNSDYNYWLAHKRLAIIHEIYAGHSSKAYNKLKSTITDDKVEVRRKYLDVYTIDNWIHIFACSNSARALQLTVDDRRWLVPGVTERKREYDYWKQFNRWLKWQGGLRKIKWWAEQFCTNNGAVLPGQEAPWTTKKMEVVEEGYSPGMAIVNKLLAFIETEYPEPGDIIITDTSLVEVIKTTLHEGRTTDKLERPMTLRKLAKARGWHVSKQRAYIKDWGTKLHGPRLICQSSADALTAPGDLAAAGRKPFDVVDLASRLWGM